MPVPSCNGDASNQKSLISYASEPPRFLLSLLPLTSSSELAASLLELHSILRPPGRVRRAFPRRAEPTLLARHRAPSASNLRFVSPGGVHPASRVLPEAPLPPWFVGREYHEGTSTPPQGPSHKHPHAPSAHERVQRAGLSLSSEPPQTLTLP